MPYDSNCRSSLGGCVWEYIYLLCKWKSSCFLMIRSHFSSRQNVRNFLVSSSMLLLLLSAAIVVFNIGYCKCTNITDIPCLIYDLYDFFIMHVKLLDGAIYWKPVYIPFLSSCTSSMSDVNLNSLIIL